MIWGDSVIWGTYDGTNDAFSETDGGDCTIDGRCRLKARLRSAEAAFLADLDRSTLADIALRPDLQLEEELA